MCGIFGLIAEKNFDIKKTDVRNAISYLFKLSESRGREASGLAVLHDNNIDICKAGISASRFVRSREYGELLSAPEGISMRGSTLAIIGHTRLMTNGRQDIFENNHPVVKDGFVCVHNGIVVNDDQLWKQFTQLSRSLEVDTEIIVSLAAWCSKKTGSFVGGINRAYKYLKGANSIAILSDTFNKLILATNNGCLYIATAENKGCIIFASERYFICRLLSRFKKRTDLGAFKVWQMSSCSLYEIDLDSLAIHQYDFTNDDLKNNDIKTHNRNIRVIKPLSLLNKAQRFVHKDRSVFAAEKIKNIVAKNAKAIASMIRCSKCLLPETFPFIQYDKEGVCNYCHEYKKIEYKGRDALDVLLKRHRAIKGTNCLIGISGGRDSSYGLHCLKTVLKMNPTAYTYDWGMVTDLARRNISRICGKLGVEHIVISADIAKKRLYIRKNIIAWLKRPELGIIPLFMAGDKQYFYWANKLMKQRGIDLLVMAENKFERTHFKHGFCGVRYRDSVKPAYHFSFFDKMKLALYYGRNYLYNPSYINSSLLDTLGAYISYYMIPHRYLYLYDYVPWDEGEVEETLVKQYGWERSSDIKTTWRIGDGTSAFYNLIYYVMAGFTENDTFRSNQIREGLMSREEALMLTREENMPSIESIRWYTDTLGLDSEEIAACLDEVPKLYHRAHRQ